MSTIVNSKRNVRSLLVNLSLATILSLAPDAAHAQSISCPQPLVFGEMVTCGAAGSVTVRPDGSTTSSCVTVTGSPQSNGRCVVTQPFPPQAVQISVSSPATAITQTSTGATMNVNSFNLITNAGGPTVTRTAPFINVPLGATLNVGATQASGRYEGVMGVTATFP